MGEEKISYHSFCWVIGTTSFRTAKLNLKIEEQLLLLDDFYQIKSGDGSWHWNSNVQKQYYDYMKEKGFLTGNADKKDKDAREKTSGLVDIGLISRDRIITPAGRELLVISRKGDYSLDNIFNIGKDSFVYFKQLLKTNIKIDGKTVRPFLVVVKCLMELGYLTYEELTYFIPLIIDVKSCSEIIANIGKYRENKISLDDVIYDRLLAMKNYQRANQVFLANKVDEELICLIGMNRKSRSYDRPYYELYCCLKEVFVNHKGSYEELLAATKAIKHKPGILWRNLLFKTTNIGVIRRMGGEIISLDCPFTACVDENDLKKIFFRYLHVFKAKATLSDYFDLNKRYFNITDIIIFEDRQLKLDLLPEYYFTEIKEGIELEMFAPCDSLQDSIALENISPTFDVDVNSIYIKLSKATGRNIVTPEQAASVIEDERYRRFNSLIDKRFSDSVLVELLDCFERRDDKRIEELVTDEAAIPTIFEYILGIIWYKISERQGNILDFMKLSLEANLLPKSHAQGGYADIIYEYEACPSYPKHSLLIEATLADGTNQRRMEMEPVSRHLGDYRIKYSNPFDYSLFISTYLDKNVVSDFRYRKIMPYTKNDETIIGLKIISLDTKRLRQIIEKKIKYKYLYKVFDKYHEMPLETQGWHEKLLKEAAGEYHCG